MSHIKHFQKNYFSSSALATYKEFNLGNKEELPKELCMASDKQNNMRITLEQFMENQEKKHLSTKFNKKEVDFFLKEKDQAMEEINIDENISNNKKKIKFAEPSENIENKVNNIMNDNKSSHILIFKGTFGKDEYNRINNEEHRHHHHHHHHHHQSHQHHDDNNNENNGIQS